MLKKLKNFFTSLLGMLFKSSKIIIKQKMQSELIPLIQKEVDGGRLDVQVDQAIKIAINDFCDKYLK